MFVQCSSIKFFQDFLRAIFQLLSKTDFNYTEGHFLHVFWVFNNDKLKLIENFMEIVSVIYNKFLCFVIYICKHLKKIIYIFTQISGIYRLKENLENPWLINSNIKYSKNVQNVLNNFFHAINNKTMTKSVFLIFRS